tara:strand:- start:218 stop:463 length:246 start_codon:yes stop_codon:yes gene_type:complete
MKHKSCHWDPGQKKIIIDGRKYRAHHQNTHPDVIVGAHLEGDNTVVVTVKQFKNSPKASAKVIFKNVGTNSTLTGGTKVRL